MAGDAVSEAARQSLCPRLINVIEENIEDDFHQDEVKRNIQREKIKSENGEGSQSGECWSSGTRDSIRSKMG